jgi:hypothetical protein
MDGVLRRYCPDVENGHVEMTWFIKKRVTHILGVSKQKFILQMFLIKL